MKPHQRRTNDDGPVRPGRRAARYRFRTAVPQGQIREEMRVLLAGGAVPPDLVDDVLVVVSELSANAAEHATADEVTVDLAVHGPGVWLQVSHDDPGGIDPAGLADASMPEPSAARGRGLAIVDALTSSVEHRRQGDRFSTECTFVGD